MDRNEQQLIDEIFANLAEAERRSGPRDNEAERYIGQLVSRQPTAPYFMTQALVLQEQEMRAMQARIADLERMAGQGQPQQGGSFLGGARMGGGSVPPAGGQFRYPAQSSGYEQAPSRNEQPPQRYPEPQPEPERRGGGVGGFLSGVAQTAAGVAGGMMLGNMLGGMFGGHSSHANTQTASQDGSTSMHEMDAARQIENQGQDTQMHEADFSGEDFGGFDDFDV